jgi:hypothetical protein
VFKKANSCFKKQISFTKDKFVLEKANANHKGLALPKTQNGSSKHKFDLQNANLCYKKQMQIAKVPH